MRDPEADNDRELRIVHGGGRPLTFPVTSGLYKGLTRRQFKRVRKMMKAMTKKMRRQAAGGDDDQVRNSHQEVPGGTVFGEGAKGGDDRPSLRT